MVVLQMSGLQSVIEFIYFSIIKRLENTQSDIIYAWKL